MGKNKYIMFTGAAFFLLYTLIFQIASDDDRRQLTQFIHENFGKTHFIMGYPHSKNRSSKKTEENESFSCDDDSDTRASFSGDMAAFFCPGDNVRKELIDLINHEAVSIQSAIFVFTDEAIAQALVDAKKRGISVEIVTDPSCLKERYNKLGLLADGGVPLFIYNPAKQTSPGIMHHKFMIFGKNKNKKSYIWTGSFNFTRSACQSNYENVIITSDKAIINKYKKHFASLKEKTFIYSTHRQATA